MPKGWWKRWMWRASAEEKNKLKYKMSRCCFNTLPRSLDPKARSPSLPCHPVDRAASTPALWHPSLLILVPPPSIPQTSLHTLVLLYSLYVPLLFLFGFFVAWKWHHQCSFLWHLKKLPLLIFLRWHKKQQSLFSRDILIWRANLILEFNQDVFCSQSCQLITLSSSVLHIAS